MKAGAPEKWQESSGDVKASDMNLALIGDREASGARIAGWIVRVSNAKGECVGSKSSDPSIDKLVGKPLKKLMK